ncbi:hypothetical protein EMIHUDRAFT_223094 [Emiliania huxleyi CCMP1516]|uniref:ATP-grasp domain-containing protein n=2 Tax=Emiliania huxleyi TaxID=2903 RepID=A0A0D3KWS2_EMIH1|nr:hypothetical protein EMIHUDRAFT_206883 [Emiliania huxleyi CCMP1516]XP_005792636.1 hypothetical protein EMIHUDRAFT_223094 [Emiliania huxleyi CCMP1516]EOD23907.1 hypothetical protein EMIHUDRAFT_206883 [Emiliania huxleyi CCMP1516]EOD40207.1 hypothetical protein EMIHUDRAFT_223094 [Emiliania huxleyi CCMP1516]|eukprot:XP_005776336.1 hypothetical protein EMIHUDRAFT_206883 [Emiliania huxleyi CCMP1516]
MPISKGVVVVVDPATTGGALAVEVSKRGYEVIALWTDECAGMEDHVNQETAAWKESKGYFCELKERPTIEDTAAYVVKLSGGKPPLAIMCGAESGVKVCDKLTEFLKMRGNTTANGMENRRDKMVQQNAVKKTGVRAVRGLDGKVWEGEIEEFVDSEPFPIVVKPVESAGSEGVKLVRTKEEAQAHFHLLMNSQRMIGASDAAVCIQEFLKGTEYVVDQVSKDGYHKTMMVWQYDKRPRNGSQFVYFGMVPVNPQSKTAQWLIQYTRCALDAIHFKNGPSHSEIMMTAQGPCLVEINCRCHGGNGAWMPLASALTGGYNQVTASIDCYLDDAAWNELPSAPAYPFKGSGCNIMFVSYVDGKVVSCPGYEEIKNFKSYVHVDEDISPGDSISKTIDLFTSTGQCILSHPDPAVVEADVKRIRHLENSNKMFIVEGVTADERASIASERTSTVRPSMVDRMQEQHATAELMAAQIEYDAKVAEEKKKSTVLAAGAAAAVGTLGAALLMVKK